MIVNTQISGGGAKTYLVVTVTGDGTDMVGGTVTATSVTYNNVSYTGTTNNNGSVSFEVDYVGAYDITYAKTDVPTTTIRTIFGIVGDVNAVTLEIDYGFVFSMIYDSTTIQTDPTGCLTYADDCAGFTPVSNPPSSLGRCGTIGSWQMNADGTSTNVFLKKCFYATFHDNGSGALCLHEKLNPQDLTKKIAEWDNVNKVWIPTSGSSSITTEDTMFCVPTVYTQYANAGNGYRLYMSSYVMANVSSPSSYLPYAHTIDGHTYEYLAIGVYPSTEVGTRLYWSISNGASTSFPNPTTFKNNINNKVIQNGYSLAINLYQWRLLQWMIMFAMKSWNGQSQIGQGGYNGTTTGMCDTLGPFAGSTSTTPSADTSVKAFIENPWGAYGNDSMNENYAMGNCLADCTYRKETSGSYTYYRLYAGQNKLSNRSYSDMSLIYSTTDTTYLSGWASVPAVYFSTLGMGQILSGSMSGSKTTGVCDYQLLPAATRSNIIVGEGYRFVENGKAGPFCMSASTSDGYSFPRQTFVFDL